MAKADIVYFTLMWLIVLLFVGTIAQKYVGLYEAQNVYFSSFVFWWGPVPLPGGALTIGVIAVSLLAKLIFASPWNWGNSGIIITHVGAILLLLGGLITALHSREGSMTIYEGETSGFFTDYHARELLVFEQDSNEKIAAFPFDELQEGKKLAVPGLPFTIEIIKACKNCNIFPWKKPADDPIFKELRGRAQKFDIEAMPPEKDDERNRSGVQFRIAGASEEKDGIHFSVDFIDISPWVEVEGKVYHIALQKQRTYLPFEIQLIDFEKQYHPATGIPRSYKSEIVLKEGDTEWRNVVSMNKPLRYKGYTFYQSSFMDNGEKEATVFAVVRNAGRMFPYISSIVMCIGLLIHMALKIPKLIRNKKMKTASSAGIVVALFALLMGISSPAKATIYDYDYSTFARLPILDQGRVKPIDTFARSYLEIFSGKSSLPNMAATEWLAELIFDPDRAYKREIFNVPNPDVQDALELPARAGHHYSYREVTDAISSHFKAWHGLFRMDEDDLTLSQKKLLELYNKSQLYGDMSRSLSLFFPEFMLEQGALAESLQIPADTKLSYRDLLQRRVKIEAFSQKLAEKQKTDGYKMTPEDARFITLTRQMDKVNRDRQTNAFMVIPPQWEQKHGSMWFSPWSLGQFGHGSPKSAAFMDLWAQAVQAYKTGNSPLWDETMDSLTTQAYDMAADGASQRLISMEVSFNGAKPFVLSLSLYIAAFVTIMASMLVWQGGLRKVALVLLASGFAVHLVGLVTRMIIMERPPVTNLYESIIFVGITVVLFGLVFESRVKNSIGIIIAASVGAFLHFLGIRFDSDGDTMGMLTAVLDTNFWLATHVTTITIGYGCCLVSAVLAHLYLVMRIIRPAEKDKANEIHRNMQGAAIVALFFAALGTILGGIWADQSWGRFWGWDPKENGAMLICLWLICLMHGRLSGRLGDLAYAAGMVFTSAVVAIAWFGVNLLSVGLHSYGFTENAAASLAIFCLAEFAIASGGYIYIRFVKSVDVT